MEVTVYQNQVEKALKVLKRQMTKEGLLKELKRRRFYEKPSVKKKRKQKEAKKKRKAAMRRMRSYNRIYFSILLSFIQIRSNFLNSIRRWT